MDPAGPAPTTMQSNLSSILLITHFHLPGRRNLTWDGFYPQRAGGTENHAVFT
jgi:hypothetical protein